MAQGRVGSQCPEQGDAVLRDGRGAAVALGRGRVAAAQHRQGAVLAGREGRLHRGPGGLGGRFPLLQVIFQQLFSGSENFLREKKKKTKEKKNQQLK